MGEEQIQDVLSAGQSMEEELLIVGEALSSPDIYLAALDIGLGPGEGQSLGEWVADTVRDARRRVATNSALCGETAQDPDRDSGTSRSDQPAPGGKQ